MLVLGVRARAVNSQPIKHRHSERSDEIAVRAAAHRAFLQVIIYLCSKPLRVLKERGYFRSANKRRPVDSAAHFDARAVEHRLERVA